MNTNKYGLSIVLGRRLWMRGPGFDGRAFEGFLRDGLASRSTAETEPTPCVEIQVPDRRTVRTVRIRASPCGLERLPRRPSRISGVQPVRWVGLIGTGWKSWDGAVSPSLDLPTADLTPPDPPFSAIIAALPLRVGDDAESAEPRSTSSEAPVKSALENGRQPRRPPGVISSSPVAPRTSSGKSHAKAAR